MKRKVVQQGPSTLMVSIPSDWARDNQVNKGDELNLSFAEGSIIFSRSEQKRENKEAILDIDDYSHLAFTKHMSMLYLTNHNKITLLHQKDKMHNTKYNNFEAVSKSIKEKAERLMGVEVVSQTPTKTELQVFYSDKTELDILERRIFYSFKGVLGEMIEAIGCDYPKFHKRSLEEHNKVAKMILYYLRELHKSDKSDYFKKVMYSVFSRMDRIIDNFRYTSEKIEEFGCTPKVKGYLEDIFDWFFELYNLSLSKPICNEIISKRNKLKQKIDKEDFSSSELRVIAEAKVFLDSIVDFAEYSIIKSLEK